MSIHTYPQEVNNKIQKHPKNHGNGDMEPLCWNKFLDNMIPDNQDDKGIEWEMIYSNYMITQKSTFENSSDPNK